MAGRGRVPGGGCRGRTHNVSLSYPELVGLTSSGYSRETVKTFTTEKHTGPGIEPGFPNCEAHAFPRRHYTLPRHTIMRTWLTYSREYYVRLYSSTTFLFFPRHHSM